MERDLSREITEIMSAHAMMSGKFTAVAWKYTTLSLDAKRIHPGWVHDSNS